MLNAREYRELIRPTPHAKRLAKSLRASLSEPEKLLVWAVRQQRATGLNMRSQTPMGPYVADFYCHRARLVIEIDGKGHHADQLIHDQRRDAWMRRCGVEVLRIRAEDVFRNLDGVMQTINTRANERIRAITEAR